MSELCPKMSENRPPEIRDKKLASGSKEETPTQFLGQYQNVSLSETELEQLKTELPSLYQKYIDKLSEYMASTGKAYNSLITIIRKW